MTRLRDLTISLPPRWRRRSDPDRGLLLQARAPGVPASGTRPELVLRCVAVDDDLATWRAAALAELRSRLDDFDLEDEDEFDLQGRPVRYARFSHRDGFAAVISEQWSWRLGATGLTLTGTVARQDYADWCEVFEAVAATVEPDPRAA